FCVSLPGRTVMLHRCAIVCVAVVIALWSMLAGAQAFDETKYPDLKGQWQRRGSAQWDPAKPAGRAQQPPLTPEYQAIWDGALAELAEGRQSYNVQALCLPSGLPRMMIAYEPMEVIVRPEITYILIEHLSELRRIYTDGRSWPEFIEPSFSGYSIGKWIDTHGDGRFDVLEVETRGFKGPRA